MKIRQILEEVNNKAFEHCPTEDIINKALFQIKEVLEGMKAPMGKEGLSIGGAEFLLKAYGYNQAIDDMIKELK